MKWYWLLAIVVTCLSLLQSEDSKRKRWADRAVNAHSVIVDRIGDLIVMAIAAWQCIVLWNLR